VQSFWQDQGQNRRNGQERSFRSGSRTPQKAAGCGRRQGGQLHRAGGGCVGISLGGGGRGSCFWRTPASTRGRRRTIWTSLRDSGGWQITSSWTRSGPPIALTRPRRGSPRKSS
jgi:hypothetical protein